jgi:threonine/homoserine/homoserine lactone efflux protein
MIDSLPPLKTFGIGFGLVLIGPKFWVFTLSAISVIGEKQLGQPSSTVAYLLFVLLAESLLLLLILVRGVLPKQSKNLLDQTSAWLTRYNRPIMMTVSLVFGLLFFYQGASGLLGL